MSTIINVVSITTQQAKENERRNYNPKSWERIIDSYSSYDECNFYLSEDGEYPKIYAIYIADNIRFCQEVNYGSCLSSGCLHMGYVKEDTLTFTRTSPMPNNKDGRMAMSYITTKALPNTFYF